MKQKSAKGVQGAKKGKDTTDAAAAKAAAAPRRGRSEMSAKTVPEKQLLVGTVEIADISLDARCVTLANVAERGEEALEGWKVLRRLDDGSRVVEFTLPPKALRAGQTLKALHSAMLLSLFISLKPNARALEIN